MIDGRPEYCVCTRVNSARKPGSIHASSKAASSSWQAGTSVSGTKRPPNSPNRPVASGGAVKSPPIAS